MNKVILIVLMLIPLPAISDGVATGTIKGYVINTSSVFVASEGSLQNSASCNTTGRFYFNLSDSHSDSMLSVILSSYHADTEVVLTGTGGCDGGTSEVLRKICTTNVPC